MIGAIIEIIITIWLVAALVFVPLFCLVKGISLLLKAIKNKDDRKSNVKRGMLNIVIFLCFVVGIKIFIDGLSRSIVASM